MEQLQLMLKNWGLAAISAPKGVFGPPDLKDGAYSYDLYNGPQEVGMASPYAKLANKVRTTRNWSEDPLLLQSSISV